MQTELNVSIKLGQVLNSTIKLLFPMLNSCINLQCQRYS